MMEDKYLDELTRGLKHANKRFKKAQKRFAKNGSNYDFSDGMYWWGVKSTLEAAIKVYKKQKDCNHDR